MKMTVALLASAACLAAGSVQAQTESYPARTIRVIVPTQPGASPDLLARTLAHHLAPRLGQQMVILNQPGGGSNIGHGAAAKATPDGYTLLVTSDALAINDTLFPDLPFKSTDFVPVNQAIASPQILIVNNALPAQDVAGLVAYAKANPGKLNFGAPQTGTLGHLAGEFMLKSLGLNMVYVPFTGAPAATKEIIAGNVHLMWITVPAVIGQVQQGAVRALAVSSAARAAALPAVPTMRELGYAGWDFSTWQGVFLPPGSPISVAARLNAEVNAVLKTPEAAAALMKIGFEPLGGTTEDFRKAVAETSRRWGNVVREAGIRPN
jgi:tripartite-type tricarboxylate transporter receptor subunit TctC